MMPWTGYLIPLLLGVLGGSFVAQPALAQCEEDLAKLERLLESEELNDRQIGIVRGMQQSASYLCSAGKEGKVREMVDSLDSILNAPGIGSPLPNTPGQPKTPQRKADTVDDRRLATSVPPELGAAGSANVHWIDRPEDMSQFWYQDIDRLDDKVRILYSTSPSLKQGRSGMWTANVYVVEISSDGEPKQHRLYSKKSHELVTMALRRGHEQVLAQRHVEGAQRPDRLDLWSVPEGNVLSSVEVPSPHIPGGMRWSWNEFRTVTTDGNVIFTTAPAETDPSGSQVSTVAWMEVSPQGEIIGWSNQRRRNAKHQFRHWFPAHTGGAGAALRITRLDEQGLNDLIDSPIHKKIGDRQIRAVVRSETRLAVADRDTSGIKLGPALERDLMWVGEMSVPKDLPTDQQLSQSNEQMLLMARTEIENGARRYIEIIKPTADGYGVLMRVAGDRRIVPDVNGRHFVEVTLAGTRRSVFLAPAADELEVKFEHFAADDDTVYVFGDGRARSDDYDGVILPILDDDSFGQAIPISIPASVSIDTMTSNSSGIWLVGHGISDALNKVALWVSRINPDKAVRVERKTARPSAEDRQGDRMREQAREMQEQANRMMAAMAGMSPDQFNSLSREQRKEVLADRTSRVQRQVGQMLEETLGVSPEALQQMSESEKQRLFEDLDASKLAKLMALSRSMSGNRPSGIDLSRSTSADEVTDKMEPATESLLLDSRMRGIVHQEFSADMPPPFTLTVRHEEESSPLLEKHFSGAFSEEIDFGAISIEPDKAVVEIVDGNERIIRRLRPQWPR